MQRKKVLLVSGIITVVLLMIQIGLVAGITLMVDPSNDVQYYEDAVYKRKGNYHEEIDIIGITFVGLKVNLFLGATPIIDDGNHFYQVEIYWNTGTYTNSTVIKVGGVSGQAYEDTITTRLVNASGHSIESYPLSYPLVSENETVVKSNRLTWELYINDITNVAKPAKVNATSHFKSVTGDSTFEFKDEASSDAAPPIFSTANLLPLAGTLLVCGFAGYTLGSITVYYLTTNIKAKEKNALFMGATTFLLAVVVNWLFWVTPWQILWNAIIYLLATVFGFFWANRGIMKIKFQSPLPDGLPIESDEKKTAVVILAKGESEEYTPLPMIRKFNAKTETGVPQKSKLMQPFEFFKVKRKYNKISGTLDELSAEEIRGNIGKNPYKKIMKKVVNKIEGSFLDVDEYQEAYVNDWPTINQALLRAISIGAKDITILNLFMADSFEYQLAIDEMKRIDFSQIGVTIKQTAFLAKSKDIQSYIAKKVTDAVPQNSNKNRVGVILIADGQPTQWDETYPVTEVENKYVSEIKGKLRKEGFNERLILNAWIEERDPTIIDAFNDLKESKCITIIAVSTTTPVDCLDSLVEVSLALEKPAEDADIELISVGAWNDDDEVISAYLGLITKAKKMPLGKLGEDASIVLQATSAGTAKLSNAQVTAEEEPSEEEDETESEKSEEE
ncbi:MAG: hypothetical protein ACTSQK_07935 [Candidatus Heimdallarchaeota archaeon]